MCKVVAPKSNNPILQMDFKAAATKEERLEATRHLVKAFGQKKGQRSVNEKRDLLLQFCGSGSGIRCLYDPLDPGWVKNRIRIRVPDPGCSTRIIFPRA